METINNITQTASNLIFGENKQTTADSTDAGTTQTATTGTEHTHAAPPSTEPISGESGKGTVNEPFDAGNKNENIGSTTTTDTTHPTESGALGQQKETATSNASTQPKESGLPGQQTETTSSNTSALPKESGLPGQQTETTAEQKTESSATNSQPGSTSADGKNSKDVPDASQTPLKEPKDKEEDVTAKKDPNDHSGEPMHMHTGEEKKEGEGKEKTEEEKKKELEEKGTGEKWVKTSGLAADGGDFDATKPGAGREADRLLEQKGIHKSEGEGPASGSDSKDDPKKPSKMEKIKEKLHIGSNKHA